MTHTRFTLQSTQLKIARLLCSKLHILSASLHPVAAVPLTYLMSRVCWTPQCYSETKMASAWVSLVVFPLRLSFIPQKTCIPSSLFIPAASNESLSDYPTALPPSHPSLSPLSSLASLLNTEIWAWILIHVGESPCVFKRFCLSSLRSPSLCCLSPSLSQWVFVSDPDT